MRLALKLHPHIKSALVLLGWVAGAWVAVTVVFPVLLFAGLFWSHSSGNTPDRGDLQEFLQRDVQQYLGQRFVGVELVEVSMLRDWPTQTGIAYPKFYAWSIFQHAGRSESGALRLAGIDGERFEVTHFVPCSELMRFSPSQQSVFPVDVYERIEEKIRTGGCGAR